MSYTVLTMKSFRKGLDFEFLEIVKSFKRPECLGNGWICPRGSETAKQAVRHSSGYVYRTWIQER